MSVERYACIHSDSHAGSVRSQQTKVGGRSNSVQDGQTSRRKAGRQACPPIPDRSRNVSVIREGVFNGRNHHFRAKKLPQTGEGLHAHFPATKQVVMLRYIAFTIRRTLADLVFLRDRKLVPLCRLLPHLLLWVLL